MSSWVSLAGRSKASSSRAGYWLGQDGKILKAGHHNGYLQQGVVMGFVSLTRGLNITSLAAGIKRIAEALKIEGAPSQARKSAVDRKDTKNILGFT